MLANSEERRSEQNSLNAINHSVVEIPEHPVVLKRVIRVLKKLAATGVQLPSRPIYYSTSNFLLLTDNFVCRSQAFEASDLAQ